MVDKSSKLWLELAKSYDTFGEFLKKALYLQNISYETLSNDLECSHQYICNICNGSNISITMCYKISKILKIDPYILGKIWSDYKIKELLNKG